MPSASTFNIHLSFTPKIGIVWAQQKSSILTINNWIFIMTYYVPGTFILHLNKNPRTHIHICMNSQSFSRTEKSKSTFKSKNWNGSRPFFNVNSSLARPLLHQPHSLTPAFWPSCCSQWRTTPAHPNFLLPNKSKVLSSVSPLACGLPLLSIACWVPMVILCYSWITHFAGCYFTSMALCPTLHERGSCALQDLLI